MCLSSAYCRTCDTLTYSRVVRRFGWIKAYCRRCGKMIGSFLEDEIEDESE